MRFFIGASFLFLTTAAFGQGYQEGVFSIPSSTAPKITDEVKVKVWAGSVVTRVEIGSSLVMVVNDSNTDLGFQVVDCSSGQMVTVNADAASRAQLAAWEGAIFPLLPKHAGFAPTWTDFSQTVGDLSEQPLARLVDRVSNRSGIESVEYNSGLFGGKVTWDFDSNQMVSWSFAPGSGRTRSLHVGSGFVNNGYQRVQYGNDSPSAISRASVSQQASVSIVNGQLVENSGFLLNSAQAESWLKAHSAYMLQ